MAAEVEVEHDDDEDGDDDGAGDFEALEVGVAEVDAADRIGAEVEFVTFGFVCWIVSSDVAGAGGDGDAEEPRDDDTGVESFLPRSMRRVLII